MNHEFRFAPGIDPHEMIDHQVSLRRGTSIITLGRVRAVDVYTDGVTIVWLGASEGDEHLRGVLSYVEGDDGLMHRTL